MRRGIALTIDPIGVAIGEERLHAAPRNQANLEDGYADGDDLRHLARLSKRADEEERGDDRDEEPDVTGGPLLRGDDRGGSFRESFPAPTMTVADYSGQGEADRAYDRAQDQNANHQKIIGIS